MAHGSQNAADAGHLTSQQVTFQRLLAMAPERIPNDPNGDTWYLQAVRTGNLEVVQFYLTNPDLDFNVVDADGNTDLMLAIIGGGQTEWGANYREIFNLIVQCGRRNWNLQNRRGETALLLAVRWGRMEVIEEVYCRSEYSRWKWDNAFSCSNRQ
jgi:ankyrin repeat protein